MPTVSNFKPLIDGSREAAIVGIENHPRPVDRFQIVRRAVGRAVVNADQFVRFIGELPNAVETAAGVGELIVRDQHNRRQPVVARRSGSRLDQILIGIKLLRFCWRHPLDLQTADLYAARMTGRGPLGVSRPGHDFQRLHLKAGTEE